MISSTNFFGALLSVLAISQHVAAVPTPLRSPASGVAPIVGGRRQTQSLFPPGEEPSYITVGAGFQNYTCSSTTGLYSSIGAIAAIVDVSSVYDTPAFANITDVAFSELTTPSDLEQAIANSSISGLLGTLTFITTESGISPKFDFSKYSQPNDTDAFALVSTVEDIYYVPTGSNDVDWLELTNIEGDLARTIFRVYTRGGQPPANCSTGSPDISVPYAAQYWFFK